MLHCMRESHRAAVKSGNDVLFVWKGISCTPVGSRMLYSGVRWQQGLLPNTRTLIASAVRVMQSKQAYARLLVFLLQVAVLL